MYWSTAQVATAQENARSGVNYDPNRLLSKNILRHYSFVHVILNRDVQIFGTWNCCVHKHYKIAFILTTSGLIGTVLTIVQSVTTHRRSQTQTIITLERLRGTL